MVKGEINERSNEAQGENGICPSKTNKKESIRETDYRGYKRMYEIEFRLDGVTTNRARRRNVADFAEAIAVYSRLLKSRFTYQIKKIA